LAPFGVLWDDCGFSRGEMMVCAGSEACTGFGLSHGIVDDRGGGNRKSHRTECRIQFEQLGRCSSHCRKVSDEGLQEYYNDDKIFYHLARHSS
jgi:hypothetical protein